MKLYYYKYYISGPKSGKFIKQIKQINNFKNTYVFNNDIVRGYSIDTSECVMFATKRNINIKTAKNKILKELKNELKDFKKAADGHKALIKILENLNDFEEIKEEYI